jgi:hypothetical protein
LNSGIEVVPDEEIEVGLEVGATAVLGLLLSSLYDLDQKVENLLGCDCLGGLLAGSPIAGDGRRCITRNPVEEKAVILTAWIQVCLTAVIADICQESPDIVIS